MTTTRDKSTTRTLWYIGQFLGVTFGAGIAAKYGIEAGLAVGYALLVLVDIRFNTTVLKDKPTK